MTAVSKEDLAHIINNSEAVSDASDGMNVDYSEFSDDLATELLGRLDIKLKPQPIKVCRIYVMVRYETHLREWVRNNHIGLNRLTPIYTTSDPMMQLRGMLPREGDELIRLPGFEMGDRWQECEDALARIDRDGIFT